MLGVIFQQYSFNAGLKKFGHEDDKAVNKELQQHHNMTTFAPIDGTKLSRKERTSALGALMFVPPKRDGIVKAITCTDRRGKHGTISKEDDMLPICLTKAISITAAMEAQARCSSNRPTRGIPECRN